MRRTRTIDDVVTVPVAAGLKGVSKQAVYDAIETGKIAGTKVGNNWLVRVRELDGWTIVKHRPRKKRDA